MKEAVRAFGVFIVGGCLGIIFSVGLVAIGSVIVMHFIPAACAADTPAPAPAPALTQAQRIYERNLLDLGREYILAAAVGLCGFRSEQWFLTFKYAMPMYDEEETARLKLSPSEHGVSERRVEAALNEYMHTHGPTHCGEYRKDGTLERLDRLQWKLSGGYH